jgi:hypothetical protein
MIPPCLKALIAEYVDLNLAALPLTTKYIVYLICILACDNGTYGLNCDFHCGACLNSEQCDHVNEICLNGCDPGFQGRLCKESKLLSQLYRICIILRGYMYAICVGNLIA